MLFAKKSVTDVILRVSVLCSVLMVAGCNTSKFFQSAADLEAESLAGKKQNLLAELRADPSLQKVSGGRTDDPAPGFEQVTPGSEQDFVVNVGREVYFVEGSAKLERNARDTLDLQAAWLNRYPQWQVKLQGHSDDPVSDNLSEAEKKKQKTLFQLKPSEEQLQTARSNKQTSGQLALSDQRANAARDYLIKKGVSADRLQTQGYGRLLPVRDCDDISCKALNRRVVSSLRATVTAFVPESQPAQ